MSNFRKLIIYFLILAIAAGIFTVVKTGVFSKKNPVVLSINPDAVTEISWSRGGSRDAEIYLFNKKKRLFKCGDEYIEKMYTDKMLEAVKEVRAKQVIKEPAELKSFGLDPAFLTVTVKADRTYVFKISSHNSVTNDFYFKVEGNENVYVLEDSGVEYAFNYDIDILLENQKKNRGVQ